MPVIPLSRRSVSVLRGEQELINYLYWNNYTSVANFTLMSYDYLLLLEKEVQYVWRRPWSPMTGLYLIVRYLGLALAIISGFWGGLVYMSELPCYGLIVSIYWGFSAYFCCSEVILILRLYALCDRSRRVLFFLLGLFLPIVALEVGIDIYLYSRTSAFSVIEYTTPIAKYCTFSFNLGPMLAIYTSIPIICYDILLVGFAVTLLIKHIKEWRNMKMKPNIYVVAIVRYHIIDFVLNMMNQILMTLLWAKIPASVRQLSALFNDTIPFIIAPRLIIDIWDTHANDGGVYRTSPSSHGSEEHVQVTDHV